MPKRLAFPRSSRSSRKHRAILDAAFVQFNKHGFAGTNMDDLADQAGVSKRTIYKYFPSKDALWDEVVGKLYTNFEQRYETAYDPSRDIREQLTEMLRHEIARMSRADTLALSRLGLSLLISAPQRARFALKQVTKGSEHLQQWLRAAHAHGAIRVSDFQFAAAELDGLLHAFALLPQVILSARRLNKVQQRRIAHKIADSFLKIYAVPGVK